VAKTNGPSKNAEAEVTGRKRSGLVIRRSRDSLLDSQEWPNLESRVAYLGQYPLVQKKRPQRLVHAEAVGRCLVVPLGN
jgi:hypothetical protein